MIYLFDSISFPLEFQLMLLQDVCNSPGKFEFINGPIMLK